MTTKTLLDGGGASFSADFNLTLGRQSAATTRSFNLSTEDNAALTAIGTQLPASLGTKTAANSLPVTLASDGPMVVATGTTADAAWASGNGTQIALLKAIAGAAIDTTTASPVKDYNVGAYETVAASATDQAIGATGATGDHLSHIIVQPATTSPGAVTIKDNTTVILTIPAGTVADLMPRTVALDIRSVSGAWKISTGTNVSVVAVGRFT